MAYQSRSKSATQGKEETTQMDYTHTEAHQMAYDFSVYLHEKMKKFPHYEKFTLQKDIRESIDGILDEIEMFEITKVASHLYAADRLKRRLVRKIRLAYDLGYSAMNKDLGQPLIRTSRAHWRRQLEQRRSRRFARGQRQQLPVERQRQHWRVVRV